jgi:predicted ATP-grasp superfamily ATP-dependent carboligase
MIYYIIKGDDGFKFHDILKKKIQHHRIIFIDNYQDISDNKGNYKIIPITINDIISYHKHEYYIFSKNDHINIRRANNKSVFTEYMIQNYPENYPKCYYYNNETNIYTDALLNNNMKKIIKPNIGFGGTNCKIIYDIPPLLNNKVVITKYHEHNIYYVGHFLVKEGIIIKHIYFQSEEFNDPDYIKKGSIIKYNTLSNNKLQKLCHKNIFIDIFRNMNYSGFACSDFIIEQGKIIIFEINPRIGGSLINSKSEIINDFFGCLVRYYNT